MIHLKKLMLTLTLALASLNIMADGNKVYYISPTGNDSNDGLSTDKPFKTLKKAVDYLSPGTTVYVMPGTFPQPDAWEAIIDLKTEHSGTADAPITFRAYNPQNRPKIKFGGKGRWNCINIQASYITIDGLELEGNNQSFDQTEAKTDSVAAYNFSKTYHNNGGTGFDWNNCANYNTNGINIGKGGKDGGFPHHVTIRNCVVHDFPGGGVGCQQGDYITFENNIIYNNAWYTMYGCSGISVLNPYNSDNNNDYKIIIKDNIVYNNHTKIPWTSSSDFRYSDGNGIIVDVNMTPDATSTDAIKNDGAYRGKTLVANNVSYFNGGSGIHAFKAQNVLIVNNTAYHNEQRYNSGYGEIFSQNGENNRICNNIMYAKAGHNCNNFTSNGGATYSNNIYYGGTYTTFTGDVVANPAFVTIPDNWFDVADFHITAESPAVAKGINLAGMPETDKDGNVRSHITPDCGAYLSSFTSNVASIGWAALFLNYPVTIPTGVKAYYASSASSGAVTMTSIDDGIIPANTAVILKAASGSHTFKKATTATPIENNLLEGCITAVECTPGDSYVISGESTPKSLVFAPFNGTTHSATKSWLPASVVGNAAKLSIIFNDGTDGIKELTTTETKTKAFNLSGQQVDANQKGIVIINEKKYLNK